jgi:hypothetical protein
MGYGMGYERIFKSVEGLVEIEEYLYTHMYGYI